MQMPKAWHPRFRFAPISSSSLIDRTLRAYWIAACRATNRERIGWMRLSGNEQAAFALFAREVFALDTAIQWFALEKAGREPCYAWRDAETGPDDELVDP